jgi:hypothetical protein
MSWGGGTQSKRHAERAMPCRRLILHTRPTKGGGEGSSLSQSRSTNDQATPARRRVLLLPLRPWRPVK